MALQAGAKCEVRQGFCPRNQQQHGSRFGWGVDVLLAQEFCFFKEKNRSPRSSKQAKTDVLLTTDMGSLRCSAKPQHCTSLAPHRHGLLAGMSVWQRPYRQPLLGFLTRLALSPCPRFFSFLVAPSAATPHCASSLIDVFPRWSSAGQPTSAASFSAPRSSLFPCIIAFLPPPPPWGSCGPLWAPTALRR